MNKMNNEKGAALLLVLLALTVLSLLGLAIAGTSLANINLTTVDREQQATYYIAEGGVNQAYLQFEEIVNHAYNTTNNEEQFFAVIKNQLQTSNPFVIEDYQTSFSTQPVANVTIEQVNDTNPRTYAINSVGTIDKRTRTVSREIIVNWKSGSTIDIPENAAALIKNYVDLSGGGTIQGDVYIDSTSENILKMDGGAKIKNTVFVPGEAVDHALQAPDWFTSPKIEPMTSSLDWDAITNLLNDFPYSVFDETKYNKRANETIYQDESNPYNPNKHDVISNNNLYITNYLANNYILDVVDNVFFQNIEISQNNTLYINTNDRDIRIYAQSLTIHQGSIEIIGSGSVSIYTETIPNLKAQNINVQSSSHQFKLYYSGNTEFSLANETTFNGSLFAPNASINLTGSGNIKGYVLTGGSTVTLTGGSFNDFFLVAPNADIIMDGSGTVNGAVIGNTLKAGGGAKVNYQPIDIDNFPFGSSSSSNSSGDLIEKQPIVEIQK